MLHHDAVQLVFEGLAGGEYTFSTVQSGIAVRPDSELHLENETDEIRTWRLIMPKSDQKYAQRIVTFVRQ